MLNYKLYSYKDILGRLRELSTNICQNMHNLNLDVDNWNEIFKLLEKAQLIISKANK